MEPHGPTATTFDMATYLLAFLGGLLTILSPCVLPIVPLVFSQAEQSRRDRMLLLLGLATTFAVVATAATYSAGWIATAGEAGRWIALAFMAVVALTLISERAATALTRPLVRAGARVNGTARASRGARAALLTGAAVGLLWAPCAGPILGLVIVGGRASGDTSTTFALLATFGLGASAALALVLSAGQRLTAMLRRSLFMDRMVRRALGTLALIAVAVIALGWDRTLLAKGEFIRTAAAEELLVKRLAPQTATRAVLGESLDNVVVPRALDDEGAMPAFPSGREWINSAPLTTESLKGKVVLVDFWTFQCINCLNALPHVKVLYAKYKDQGLMVIGVHTPELPRERVPANVRAAVQDLGIAYPVVIDGDFGIWNSWKNQYWPAAYFVDTKGRVRFHHFGEGKYEEQEIVVKRLLAEAKEH